MNLRPRRFKLRESVLGRLIAAQAIGATLAIFLTVSLVLGFGHLITEPLIDRTMTILESSVELGLRKYVTAGDWFNLERDLDAINDLAKPTVRFALITPVEGMVLPQSLKDSVVNRLALRCKGKNDHCWSAKDKSDWEQIERSDVRYMVRSVAAPNALAGSSPKLVTALSVAAFKKLETQVLWFIFGTIMLIVLVMVCATLIVTHVSLVTPVRLLVARITNKAARASDLEQPLGRYEPTEVRECRQAVLNYLMLIDRQILEKEAMLIRQAQLERDAAVARMTGMLAHDVRKPFSLLRMGLGMLGNAKDPASIKRILAGLVPEIDKAVSSVDGLIADVMEVGSTSTQLIQEPASPESLIEATLGEICRIYPKANVSITYDLQHCHMVNVHVQKVGRVLSNIVGNALQAMKYHGDIWFTTREHSSTVEFCIGNTGSVIPPESLTKLFDAFFTSGKKGGTGLGLAIAQKVVTAHGGRIWCESSRTADHPDGKVEFFFSLPIASGHPCVTTATLPKHSSEIIKALQAIAGATNEGSIDTGELTLEADIIQRGEQIGRPLRVLVVDDEQIYRSAIASYLGRTPELVHALTLTQASSASEALVAVDGATFDLVVTDVDLGKDSFNGFELVKELRAKQVRSLVCVHSNRIVAADHRTAFVSGADAFLPKPMARAQLLRLILQAAQAGHWADVAAILPINVDRQGSCVTVDHN